MSSSVSAGGLGSSARLGLAASSSSSREALLQPLAAAPERLVDGLGRGGEPALQDRQREADGALSAFAQSLSARLNSSRTYSVTSL